MVDNAPDEQHDLQPQETLENSIVEATFRGVEDRGLAFDIDGEQTAYVERDEFGEVVPFEAGERVRLLIEWPIAGDWHASVRKAEKLELWDWVERTVKSGDVVEGTIVGENKGGLSVDIGLRAFLPLSQVDLHRVDDVTPYLGRTEQFQIIKFDKKRGNVVVSRRNLLEQQLEERRSTIEGELVAGREFDGVVRTLTNFGAFVDIGGIDGLLHVSNMSWGRVDHPSELVRPGDTIRVVVLDYNPDKKRLSLGRKQLLEDPWEQVGESFTEGAVVSGKVVSLADFGAFVEIAEGLEGLVHVTELVWTGRINHPREVLDLGQQVDVKILNIDTENRRLSLSIKQLTENPWEQLARELEPGSRVEGAIRNITDFGLFVEVAPGIEGLVHVSDLSWTEKIDDPRTRYQVGQTVEVVVIEVDAEAGRIALGIKQLEDDPWQRASEIAKPGQKIDVTITRLTDFGAFAQIVEGVEGLIHISELSEDRVETPSAVVRPGQQVKALVISFDRGGQRISLSLKRDSLADLDEKEAREYIDEGGATATLGDILRDRLGLPPEGGDEDDAPGEE